MWNSCWIVNMQFIFEILTTVFALIFTFFPNTELKKFIIWQLIKQLTTKSGIGEWSKFVPCWKRIIQSKFLIWVSFIQFFCFFCFSENIFSFRTTWKVQIRLNQKVVICCAIAWNFTTRLWKKLIWVFQKQIIFKFKFNFSFFFEFWLQTGTNCYKEEGAFALAESLRFNYSVTELKISLKINNFLFLLQRVSHFQ